MIDKLERVWKEAVTQRNAAAILEFIWTEENHEISQLRKPVSHLRSKPSTCQIQV
jgi:hypothetical protein